MKFYNTRFSTLRDQRVQFSVRTLDDGIDEKGEVRACFNCHRREIFVEIFPQSMEMSCVKRDEGEL